MTGVGEGFADGESETGALHKIVNLVETLEDLGLSLFRDARTGILTIGIQAFTLLTIHGSGFRTVAHLNMTLMGVFHGVGHEVGDDL